MKYKKAMKDFESLSTEEQTDVIMQIGAKLTGQEIWYWEGIVHLLRNKQEKIDEAIEIYENRNSIEYKKKRFMEDKNTSDLMYEVLQGSDKE